jgi:hypothetical protein
MVRLPNDMLDEEIDAIVPKQTYTNSHDVLSEVEIILHNLNF